MKKKAFAFLFWFMMLALMFYPGWYLYQHPEMLAMPPQESRGAGNTVEGNFTDSMLAVQPTSTMLAIPHETPKSSFSASRIVVIADTVNLRYSSGRASGQYLHDGDVVVVVWDAGNFGRVVEPKQFAGLLIWRGCTSDAGNLGCEAK